MCARDARRRRILEGGQNRLALITRRKNSNDPDQDPDSDPQLINGQSFAANIEEEQTSRLIPSSQHDRVETSSQKDILHSEITEESFVQRPEPHAQPSRFPAREDNNTAGTSPAVPMPLFIFVSAAMQFAQKIPLGNLTVQQVSMGVAETEYTRILCALIMGVLVVLSYAGFPILGSRIFQWIVLFRPLFLLLMVNLGSIARKIHMSQKNSGRGEKEKEKIGNNSILGDGLAWAEDAGRALELGLMLQSVTWALLMDCSVYAAVVVFFLSPFV